VLPLTTPQPLFATAARHDPPPLIEPYRGIDGVHLWMTDIDVRKLLGPPPDTANSNFYYLRLGLSVLLTDTDPDHVYGITVHWPEPDDVVKPKHPVRYRVPKTGITIGRSTRADVKAAYRGRIRCTPDTCQVLPLQRRNADGHCGTFSFTFAPKSLHHQDPKDIVYTIGVGRCGGIDGPPRTG
jgi:hypothetical protein